MSTTDRTTDGRTRRRTGHRPAAATLVAALALGALAACSTTTAQDEPTGGERIASSLEAVFEQYLARDDLSDFERDVLERAVQDGEISAEDYETAHAREAACMADAGYDITYEKLANGLYKSSPRLPQLADNEENGKQVDAYMATSETCSTGVSIVVESLYTLQQGNPDLLVDQDEAAVQCLRKAGLVPGDYTAETFADELPKSFSSSPFDPSGDAAQACFAGAGIAYAAAQE